MQCRWELAERDSAGEEAAMSATVIPLLTYDKLYPLGDLPDRRERSYGSRTPPLYSLSCVNRRSSVRTGRSPPEEEQSFHSVRAHATCGGTKHPSSPWEVGGKACTPSDGSTTRALLRFMRPVHLPSGCVASMCLLSLAMLAAWSITPSLLLPVARLPVMCPSCSPPVCSARLGSHKA